MSYTGELAALATSVFFSLTSTQFTLAGRQVGALVVNRTRLVLAVLFLVLAHFILRIPLPIHAEPDRWFWLGLSGILGLIIGDLFLFQAFIWIGPRLSMLLMALHPIIAALAAWVFLSEELNIKQIAAIMITLTGIAWVILEGNHRSQKTAGDRRLFALGILFGFGAATGQALGLITAKPGLSDNFSPVSGTLIRMLTATIVIWVLTLISGQAGLTWQRLKANRKAQLFILGGSFSGPFLGVTFSLLAIQQTEVGIASTLMALPPVILLPISYFMFGERFGWQAVVGTLLAIAGVALLFMV